MVLVVDASVAVKWLVPEEGSDLALGLHDSTQEMHAPRLLAAEVTNALWRKARVGELDQAEASALAAEVSRLPVQWHTDETICADATRLAIAYDRPVYDFMYLALAQRLSTRLVTADQRFVNALAAGDCGDLVVELRSAGGDG